MNAKERKKAKRRLLRQRKQRAPFPNEEEDIKLPTAVATPQEEAVRRVLHASGPSEVWHLCTLLVSELVLYSEPSEVLVRNSCARPPS